MTGKGLSASQIKAQLFQGKSAYTNSSGSHSSRSSPELKGRKKFHSINSNNNQQISPRIIHINKKRNNLVRKSTNKQNNNNLFFQSEQDTLSNEDNTEENFDFNNFECTFQNTFEKTVKTPENEKDKLFENNLFQEEDPSFYEEEENLPFYEEEEDLPFYEEEKEKRNKNNSENNFMKLNNCNNEISAINKLRKSTKLDEDITNYKKTKSKNNRNNRSAFLLKNQETMITIIRSLQEDIRSLKNPKIEETDNDETSQQTPLEIRDAVWKGYKQCTSKWVFGNRINCNSEENKNITNEIKQFVKGAFPEVKIHHLQNAISRYFSTKREEHCRKKSTRGIEIHRNAQKFRQRKLNKLKRRLSALQSIEEINEKKRNEYQKFLKIDFMSSDESASEDENILLVRKYNWHSSSWRKFVNALDKKAEEMDTPKQISMRKARIKDQLISAKEAPSNLPINCWIVKK